MVFLNTRLMSVESFLGFFSRISLEIISQIKSTGFVFLFCSICPVLCEGAVSCGLFVNSNSPSSLYSLIYRNHELVEKVRDLGLLRTRDDLDRMISNLDPSTSLILRGVAPQEARMIVGLSETGRVRERMLYGIREAGVRPGFLIGRSIDRTDLEDVFYDVGRYAVDGAIYEMFSAKYKKGEPISASDVNFNKRHIGWNIADIPIHVGYYGYWIVYGVPRDASLSFYPKSKVRKPEHVVDIPDFAEIIAVIPGRSN